MAASTGIVLTAGAFSVGDLILNAGYTADAGVQILVGTVAAAFVSAGLDKVAPGLGTGLAVLLLVAAILGKGPGIAAKIFPQDSGIRAGIRPA